MSAVDDRGRQLQRQVDARRMLQRRVRALFFLACLAIAIVSGPYLDRILVAVIGVAAAVVFVRLLVAEWRTRD